MTTQSVQVADGVAGLGDYLFFCPSQGRKPAFAGRVETIQGDWIGLRGEDGRIDEVPAKLTYRQPWQPDRSACDPATLPMSPALLTNQAHLLHTLRAQRRGRRPNLRNGKPSNERA